MQCTWVWSLDQEDPLEKEMAVFLPRKIPWAEEPGGLQSMGSQKSWIQPSTWAQAPGYHLLRCWIHTHTHTHTHTHIDVNLIFLFWFRIKFSAKYCIWLCLFSLFWRRQWQPTPVLLPGKSHGRRSLVGCSPWGHEESDTYWATSLSLSCIGKGNGNLLQCSCLENPRDGRAWWAAICGDAQSWTRLKRLSSSSSSLFHSICLFTF